MTESRGLTRSGGGSGQFPARRVRLDQLHGEAAGVVRVHERLEAVGGVEDAVLEDGGGLLHAGHRALDVVGLDGDVFEPLADGPQVLTDARLRVPVVDHMQPALVAEQLPGVELEAAPLVGAQFGGFEPDLPEPLGGGGVAPVGGTDVLETEDHGGGEGLSALRIRGSP